MRAALCLRIAAVHGGLAVALGAFAAHGLKARLSPEMLTVFETGVKYHFYHALALMALGAAGDRLWAGPWAAAAAWAWSAGILLFSGSLYLLAASSLRGFGAITPIGGTAFLLGWAFLFLAAARAGN